MVRSAPEVDAPEIELAALAATSAESVCNS